jgi:ankyrin repeat protein
MNASTPLPGRALCAVLGFLTLFLIVGLSGAPAPAPVYTEDQILESFGWFVGKRLGLAEEGFSKEQIDSIVKGMLMSAAGRDAPYDIEKIGPQLNAFMQQRQQASLSTHRDQNPGKPTAAPVPAAATEDLVNAAATGDAPKVDALLATGVSVDSAWSTNGLTPLIAAAQGGHLEIVQKLIAARANLDAKTSDGLTALMQASQIGNLPIAKALLAAGADLNVKRNDGATALIGACQNGHVDVALELIKARADVNAATLMGVTPLHAASLYGHTDIVKALIEAKAQLNAKDSRFGATPLIMASQRGNTDVVKLLLDSHADPRIRMANGLAAVDVASSQGHTKIVELLQGVPAE